MRPRLFAFLLPVVLGAACKGKAEVSFEIALPSSLVSNTVWFEVGAFKDGKCASLSPILRGGIPEGAARRVAFRRDDRASPKFGDLKAGPYAFAAVAKGDDCAVLATGCAEADVSETETVSVQMSATSDPSGACGVGASCEAAACVPANDNADPSVGAGCSLELLGAGPLANPAAGGGTLVSAPDIAATPSGFVIVYREVDSNAGRARITILPIDPAGGALPSGRPPLERCGSQEETDGVAILLDAGDGQVVVARPACTDQGGKPAALELVNFSTKPEVTYEDTARVSTSPAPRILLSPSGVTGARAGGNVMAFVEDGVARVSTVRREGVGSPTGTFGATTGNTGAWAATSDTVLALLAAGPPAAGPSVDGGAADGGSIDDETGPTLRLTMVPISTQLDQLTAPDVPRVPIAFPGEFGALAAKGSRVIVASDGSGPGRSVSYRTFDLNTPSAVETSGFSVEGSSKVTAVDLAIQGDRVFFATLKPGFVGLNAFAGATTTPRPIHAVSFSSETRIPAINQVRDGKVAVAATDSRVAVVWTTAKLLTNNDPAGGYAVFACTQ